MTCGPTPENESSMWIYLLERINKDTNSINIHIYIYHKWTKINLQHFHWLTIIDNCKYWALTYRNYLKN